MIYSTQTAMEIVASGVLRRHWNMAKPVGSGSGVNWPKKLRATWHTIQRHLAGNQLSRPSSLTSKSQKSTTRYLLQNGSARWITGKPLPILSTGQLFFSPWRNLSPLFPPQPLLKMKNHARIPYT